MRVDRGDTPEAMRFCENHGVKALQLAVWLSALALASEASAVELSTVEFGGKSFTVCQVNLKKDRLQLFHRDENGHPFKRFSRLASWLESRGQKLTFAMNAGMFHGDLSAVGLFVSDGQQVVPLNTADGNGNFFLKPNGVFAVAE
jgi:uncharacterized protein YigE (DUF2233 family)